MWVPSMRDAQALIVEGDWLFGDHVKVVGEVKLTGDHGRVESGTVLSGSQPA